MTKRGQKSRKTFGLPWLRNTTANRWAKVQLPMKNRRRGASAPKRVVFCMPQPALVVSRDRIIVSAMSGDRMKKKRSYPGEAMNPFFHALTCGASGGVCFGARMIRRSGC